MTSSLDAQTRRAERNGRVLDLTKTEFDLLELLMLNAGIVLTRDTIYQRIWGYDFETSSRSLDVYVGYLRTKTEAGGEPRLLHTMRGVGYVLGRHEPPLAHRGRPRRSSRASSARPPRRARTSRRRNSCRTASTSRS